MRLQYQIKGLLPSEKPEKTYIIPVKLGFIYGTLCLILLYTSFATGNNLMYLYTFFLTGIGIASLWLTHANIKDIDIESITIEDVFADQSPQAWVELKNSSTKDRHHIYVYQNSNVRTETEDLPKQVSKTVRISFSTYPRGRHKAPKIFISTSFPFMLLKAWKAQKPQQEFFVYPHRRGRTELPVSAGQQENRNKTSANYERDSESEFHGHRKFTSSDSARQIDWKAYARTDRLLVKDHQGQQLREIKISWAQTTFLNNFEDRLSQMALWVDIAETKGLFYSFEIGPLNLKAARGRAHHVQCLRYLAEATEDSLR